MKDATWYLDGSMVNGEIHDLRTTGFAIVVVSKSQGLVGFGGGTPPWWCRTAASAETWALQVALSYDTSDSQLRTDCQSLLTIAESGLMEATAASRPLARVWHMIAHHVDDDIASLVSSQRLVWLPAHQTTGAIMNRWLSNGKRFSVVDWRANRLADAVAKMMANDAAPASSSVNIVKSGIAACRHAAAVLGLVTHTANNFVVANDVDSASGRTKRIRDAQAPLPIPKRPTLQSGMPGPAPAADAGISTDCLPPHASSVAELGPLPDGDSLRHESAVRWIATGKDFAKRARHEQEARLQNRVNEIGANLSCKPGMVPGSARLDALKLRIREKALTASHGEMPVPD